MTYYVLQSNPDAKVYFIRTGSEQQDSLRFLHDCESWFNHRVIILQSSDYVSHFDCIEKTRYINGAAGARCSFELKKKVRYSLEDSLGSWDAQYFGFDISEEMRAMRFREQNPKTKAQFPLIDLGLSKSDCMAILVDAGIKIPDMYRLGFHNNNCIGCVKGGKSYWALIRKCFPDVFNKMARLERTLNHSCINGCFLDELPLNYTTSDPIVPSCNLWCDLDFFSH